MKRRMLLARALTFAALLPTTVFAGRAITPEDYFAFQVIADPHISPDGTQVAFVLTSIDQQRNRRDSSIWLVAVDGRSEPRRFSPEGFNANHPRWSPDGSRLASISARTGDAATRPQIYVMPAQGGEAQALSNFKNGVTDFEWSPDGRRFVAVSRIGPERSSAAKERCPPLHARLI
jgi:dipeptidyl aminopeptidase/acylaminoacyl peptidase